MRTRALRVSIKLAAIFAPALLGLGFVSLVKILHWAARTHFISGGRVAAGIEAAYLLVSCLIILTEMTLVPLWVFKRRFADSALLAGSIVLFVVMVKVGIHFGAAIRWAT